MVQEYDKTGAIFLYDAYEGFINGAIWKYASKPIKRTLNHVCTTNRKKGRILTMNMRFLAKSDSKLTFWQQQNTQILKILDIQWRHYTLLSIRTFTCCNGS